MKVLILGTGFIGSALMRELIRRDVSVVCASLNQKQLNVAEVDLTCKYSTQCFIDFHKPTLVINCAGLAGFTRCEIDPKLSRELNVNLSNFIVDLARQYQFKYTFFSSSYVFEGSQSMHLETEIASPKSVYGRHKILAERYIQRNLTDFLILRLDTVFSIDEYTGKARVGGGLLGGTIPLVPGSFVRTPISLKAVAEITSDLIQGQNIGLYHISGDKVTGLREFYQAIQKELGIDVRFRYLQQDEVIIPPPENTSLSTSKIKGLGIKVPRYLYSWF